MAIHRQIAISVWLLLLLVQYFSSISAAMEAECIISLRTQLHGWNKVEWAVMLDLHCFVNHLDLGYISVSYFFPCLLFCVVAVLTYDMQKNTFGQFNVFPFLILCQKNLIRGSSTGSLEKVLPYTFQNLIYYNNILFRLVSCKQTHRSNHLHF